MRNYHNTKVFFSDSEQPCNIYDSYDLSYVSIITILLFL